MQENTLQVYQFFVQLQIEDVHLYVPKVAHDMSHIVIGHVSMCHLAEQTLHAATTTLTSL